MKKKKGFNCEYCGSPLKLYNKKEDRRNEYHIIIICSRNLCVFEYKDKTDEKTVKYFKDNGGVEDGKDLA